MIVCSTKQQSYNCKPVKYQIISLFLATLILKSDCVLGLADFARPKFGPGWQQGAAKEPEQGGEIFLVFLTQPLNFTHPSTFTLFPMCFLISKSFMAL